MKKYNFTTKYDYVFYLSEIIIDIIKYKKRLISYQSEIQDILEKNPEKKLIESTLYENFSDKIKALLYYIFNLIGDETKTAVSYRKFRKILYSKKSELNLKIPSLTEKESTIISDFNTHRNWGLHIPESLFNNKKEFLKIDNDFLQETQHRIVVPIYQYFEIKYLEMLSDEIKEVITSIEIIEKRMLNDYQELIGSEVEIDLELQEVKPYILMDIVKGSFDLQKRKNK